MKMPWWFYFLLATWIAVVSLRIEDLGKKVDKLWADSYLSAEVVENSPRHEPRNMPIEFDIPKAFRKQGVK